MWTKTANLYELKQNKIGLTIIDREDGSYTVIASSNLNEGYFKSVYEGSLKGAKTKAWELADSLSRFLKF